MGLDPPFGSEPTQQAPSVDPVKPRVIFSSNIPQKIADCVSERRLFIGGSKSRLVDLASDIGELDIILELNTLLLRNRYLLPTDLVKRNLIFVAKRKSYKHTPKPFMGFKGIWKSIFEMSSPSEIFVVTLKVSLRRLVVDLANVNHIVIVLHHEELYDPILRDIDLLKAIKTYIHEKLLIELKNNSTITSDISDTNTILQDLPVNDSLPLMKDLHNQTEELDNSLADITLDSQTSMPFLDKQLVYDDFAELNTSDEDIKVLFSDDSGRCTVDDEDEIQYSDKSKSNVLSPVLGGRLPALIESTESKESSFCLNDTSSQDNLHEYSAPKTALVEPQPRTPTRRLTVLRSPHGSRIESDYLSPRSVSVPTELSPRQAESAPSLMKRTSMSTLQPSLKKKSSTSSFTMVSSDENHGLEYAFRDKSPTVPTYIKRDKKFKFIKVGKVQKFVNLFEEQMPGSESSTRNNSRPGSPLKGPRF